MVRVFLSMIDSCFNTPPPDAPFIPRVNAGEPATLAVSVFKPYRFYILSLNERIIRIQCQNKGDDPHCRKQKNAKE
jgi:hypothetical protein